ncbi:hypothetical protein Tco_1116521, partial [Tanacetum coccineum]
ISVKLELGASYSKADMWLCCKGLITPDLKVENCTNVIDEVLRIKGIIDKSVKDELSLVALVLGLIRWQQLGRSEGSRVSSQTLTLKHMDWFTAGLDVPTAKLFLIPTGKLMVPAGRLCGSYWSAYGFCC